MNEPPPVPAEPIVLEYGHAELIQGRPLMWMAERVIHFYTTILLPILCFALSYEHYEPGPKWQQGHWADYLGMIPTGAGWPFYPLLAFSMFAAGCMIFRPKWAIHSLLVRVGLFTGVLLAWQYALIQIVTLQKSRAITSVPLGIILPPVVSLVVVLIYRLADELVWQRDWYRGRVRLYFWIGLGLLIAIPTLFREGRSLVLGTTIFGSLFAAPALTMVSFALMLIVCLTHGHLTQRTPLVVFAWFAGWASAFSAAWIKSYIAAVEAYTKLPTSDPSCYIATAAARGHASIVGSWSADDGHRMNRQLAMFKAGEKALARRLPSTHRQFRRIYDTIGPSLAGRIRQPWVADLAYLTLKPLEWLTACVLSALADRQ